MNRSIHRFATLTACALIMPAAMAQMIQGQGTAPPTGGAPIDAQAPARAGTATDSTGATTGQTPGAGQQQANPAGRSPQADADLSVDCPPAAAGGMSASSRHDHQKMHGQHAGRDASADRGKGMAAAAGGEQTPLTDRREQAQLRRELAQCTSQSDRTARAECVRQAWEAREAPPSPETMADAGMGGANMAAMQNRDARMNCR